MLTYFAIALALSAALLLVATAMERSAIKNRINGANGLTLLAAFIVSGLGSLLVSLIAAWLWGWPAGLASLALSGLWHWAMWKAVMRNIQRLVDKTLGKTAAPNRNGA